jgi:hypothetical protein
VVGFLAASTAECNVLIVHTSAGLVALFTGNILPLSVLFYGESSLKQSRLVDRCCVTSANRHLSLEEGDKIT